MQQEIMTKAREGAEATPELRMADLFERMNALLRIMNDPSTSLEQNFSCYQQGMELFKLASRQLDELNEKVRRLSGEGDFHELDS